MGDVRTKIVLGKFALEALVDTGATFSAVPTSVLRQCGVKPERRVRIELANRTRIWRSLGTAEIAIDGRRGKVPVLFARRGEPVLLGYTALEILGFVVDPARRKLVEQRFFIHYGCW